MPGRSVMQHKFSEVPSANIQRSVFDRSHTHRTTLDSGWLVPFFHDEVLPGDTHSCTPHIFARMATPLHPLMENLFFDYHFFFVPYRILWDNWEKFCGAQDDPDDSIDFTVPRITSLSTGYWTGSLFDYLGLPCHVGISYNHNALACRAYNLIYKEWYRDQNLQDSPVINTGDGPDAYGDFPLRRRGKRHDYFTACLPNPQKGDALPLPIGLNAPVHGIGINSGSPQSSTPLSNVRQSGEHTSQFDDWRTTSHPTLFNYIEMTGPGPNDYPNIMADLSSATGATINSLREAITVQRMMERDARSGTRYPEVIKAHFGVTSPDFRVQRPEYIGGGSAPVAITSVPQTSETGTGTPQGNLAAFGTVSASGNGFTYSATEHGCILGICSVRADLTYSRGLHRSFSRQTRYDYYWPEFAMLGEQAVLNKELYLDTDITENEDVFGYQEAWADYRYKNSLITGEFRHTGPTPLDSWHLSIDFGATRPTLSDSFIQDTPPVDRVVATPDEAEFIVDAYFQLQSARPLPVNSVPGLTRF